MEEDNPILVTTSLVIDEPDSERQSEIRRVISDRLRRVLRETFADLPAVAVVGSVQYASLSHPDNNCGRCVRCGCWTTDWEKPESFQGLPIGRVLGNGLTCDQCECEVAGRPVRLPRAAMECYMPAAIRLMVVDDLPIVTTFLRELYAGRPEDAHLEELPTRLSEFSLVAERDGVVVGMLIASQRMTRDVAVELGRDAFPDEDQYLEIQELFVNGVERGNGIGSMLVRQVLERGKAAGIRRAMVYSGNADYVQIAGFYEICGFKVWHIFMTHDAGI